MKFCNAVLKKIVVSDIKVIARDLIKYLPFIITVFKCKNLNVACSDLAREPSLFLRVMSLPRRNHF